MPQCRFTSFPAAKDFCGPHRIPSREDARKEAYCPKRIYRCRHKIENFFRRIKDWHRIATGYDKLARNFLAAIHLVAALYLIRL